MNGAAFWYEICATAYVKWNESWSQILDVQRNEKWPHFTLDNKVKV